MLHRKNIRLALIFAGMAILMCAPAAFGQAIVSDTPFTGQPATNTCNGDAISVSGTFHSETTSSTNPNGFIHFSFNSTLKGTGVGMPSGANYVVNESQHTEVNSKTVAMEQYISTKMKLIAQGPSPNMTLRTTIHLVVNANGTVTVSTSGFQTSCN
jgi:hypothetical protein